MISIAKGKRTNREKKGLEVKERNEIMGGTRTPQYQDRLAFRNWYL